MKQSEKRMIAILIAITVVVIAIVMITKGNKKGNIEETQGGENTVKEEFVERLEDGTRLNTSNKLQETKIIDGMEISGIQLTEKDNVSIILGTVTNKTKETKGGYPVDVKIVDKKGEEIITISAIIGELAPGESSQFSTSATFDYANAYDFVITRK